MGEIEKNHIRTNAQKEEKILEFFYDENFRKKDKDLFNQYIVSKVNLARNETIENAKMANASDYTEQIKRKKTATVTEKMFVIGKDEPGFNLLFYTGTNYYDRSNPQSGRKENLTRQLIKNQLSKVNKKGKTYVVFGGDLLGSEWEIKYLRNAEIKDGKILYYGMNKRKERLIWDVKAYLHTAEKLGIKKIDVYLMGGAQEHKIKKELGRDILQEACEELNDPRVHYIDEGVSLGVNVIKEGSGITGILGLQTNQTGKAKTINGANRSSIRDNGELLANLIFRCNSNVVGKLTGDDIYNVSTQSTYLRTPRGQKPDLHAKYYDVFWVNLENPYEFSVVVGGTNIFDQNVALEQKRHENIVRKNLLLDQTLQIVKSKLHENIIEKNDEIEFKDISEVEYGA